MLQDPVITFPPAHLYQPSHGPLYRDVRGTEPLSCLRIQALGDKLELLWLRRHLFNHVNRILEADQLTGHIQRAKQALGIERLLALDVPIIGDQKINCHCCHSFRCFNLGNGDHKRRAAMVESARIDCLNMLNVATTFFMYADFIVHPPGFGILIIADYAPITTESGEKRRKIHQFEAIYLLELYGQTGATPSA